MLYLPYPTPTIPNSTYPTLLYPSLLYPTIPYPRIPYAYAYPTYHTLPLLYAYHTIYHVYACPTTCLPSLFYLTCRPHYTTLSYITPTLP